MYGPETIRRALDVVRMSSCLRDSCLTFYVEEDVWVNANSVIRII
jgi:hypothetical protein